MMSDLALATPGSLGRLFSGADDLTLAPGRGGGTNGFVVRTDEAASRFRVDYHGASYLDHVERARDEGLGVSTVDSFRLSTDVDEPDDIVEVLIHGDGESHDYVDGLFELVSDDDENRVTIRRR
ncbi:MAG: hypothetical protein SV760_07005 [Halobacteria archaeon]|nr:hypothetical protein [Halobacteria archaeon]